MGAVPSILSDTVILDRLLIFVKTILINLVNNSRFLYITVIIMSNS